MKIHEIRSFIPCKHYSRSQEFYRFLGFESEAVGEDMTIFSKDGCTFFLQSKFYSEEFCSNLIFQLVVPDISTAYETVSGLEGDDIKYTEIKHERWGKVIYLWGPSGELWQITELLS